MSVGTEPFRGSAAVAAALVSVKELRGPRFRQLYRDIYVAAAVEVDLGVRSRGAHLLGGVLGGWSAAEVLGASCGRRDGPAEIVVSTRRRSQVGLMVRHESLADDEIAGIGGIRVTTPIRTAYDLARRKPLVEAVVAVDALARAFTFAPDDVLAFARRYPGARDRSGIAAAVRLADPLAASPMETRIRIAIHQDGLVAPVLQHPVGPYRLDMAYPAILLGIEYNGRDHLTPERSLRDLDREAYLGRAGWHMLRFRAADVLHRPWWVASHVREQLILAARSRGLALHELDPR